MCLSKVEVGKEFAFWVINTDVLALFGGGYFFVINSFNQVIGRRIAEVIRQGAVDMMIL